MLAATVVIYLLSPVLVPEQRKLFLSPARVVYCRCALVFGTSFTLGASTTTPQPKPAGEGLANRAAKPAGAAGASMAKRYVAEGACALRCSASKDDPSRRDRNHRRSRATKAKRCIGILYALAWRGAVMAGMTGSYVYLFSFFKSIVLEGDLVYDVMWCHRPGRHLCV